MIFDELMDALAQNGWQMRRRDEILPAAKRIFRRQI